ncbi:MAG: hypothetical protein HC898_13030 [Phycisphaerales bacterium]|nr:hypothetical protein [Phycisphaerales bacterium]
MNPIVYQKLNSELLASSMIKGPITPANVESLIPRLNVNTLNDSALLYSGRSGDITARSLAEAYAKLTGKTTLEMTPGGRMLDGLYLYERPAFTDVQADAIWKSISARYANAIRGDAEAILINPSPTSIYLTTERVILTDPVSRTRVNLIEHSIDPRYPLVPEPVRTMKY